MEKIPMWTIFVAVIALLSIIYYIIQLIKVRDDERFDYIFSRSSQITFLVLLLAFGCLMVAIIANGMSGATVIRALLVVLAVVGVTNMLGIIYYSHQNKKKNNV